MKVSGKTSDALFPPIRGKEEFIGYNMLEKLKKVVDEDIGEAFELRKRRRTFGVLRMRDTTSTASSSHGIHHDLDDAALLLRQ